MRVPQEVGGHPARRVVQRRSGQGYEQLLNRMDLLTVVLKKGKCVYLCRCGCMCICVYV